MGFKEKVLGVLAEPREALEVAVVGASTRGWVLSSC